jgi:hypothetical protein
VSSSGAEPTPPPSSSAVPVPPPAPDRLSPAAELLTFEILATRPVALEVTVDGARHESRTVAAGERLTFRAEREMTLKMGDAGAVQLTINGQPAVALGAAGEPRTVQIGRRNYGSFLASQ